MWYLIINFAQIVIDPKIESVIPCLTRNPEMKKDWIPAFAGMTFSCYFVSQGLVSIPAKAEIQKFFRKSWIPDQVRNDDKTDICYTVSNSIEMVNKDKTVIIEKILNRIFLIRFIVVKRKVSFLP